MPGEASTVGANLGLDAITGRAATAARTTYLACLTAAPTDATTLATMAEAGTPGTAGYARPAVTWGAPTGDPATTSNTNAITVGPLTADLAAVTHLALVSAATGTAGDFLYWWAVDTAKDPAAGDSITLAAGALVARLD